MKRVLAVLSAWILTVAVSVVPVSSPAALGAIRHGASLRAVTAAVPGSAPAMPSGNARPTASLRATATAHGITYTWTASTSTYTGLGYNLYIGTTAGGESATPANSALVAAGCSGTSCTYTYPDVTAQSTYYAVLAACVPSGSASVCSAKTAEVAATIPLAESDIASPTGFGGSAF